MQIQALRKVQQEGEIGKMCGGSPAILNKVVKEGFFDYLQFFTRWDKLFICISNSFFRVES